MDQGFFSLDVRMYEFHVPRALFVRDDRTERDLPPLPPPRTDESASDFWSRLRDSDDVTASGRIIRRPFRRRTTPRL